VRHSLSRQREIGLHAEPFNKRECVSRNRSRLQSGPGSAPVDGFQIQKGRTGTLGATLGASIFR